MRTIHKYYNKYIKYVSDVIGLNRGKRPTRLNYIKYIYQLNS